mgnify:CR=1 FL=1
MELPELQQGLQNIQQGQLPPEAAAAPDAPWLIMDNMMGAYGNWFGNDAGLGEMLLGQLRARGVDTQAATEAMLRELLGGLVNDLNLMQQKLSVFISEIAQQTQQTQAVADSIQAAIDGQNPNAMATEVLPPTGAESPVMNDIPPDMGPGGEATMPPVDSNVPPEPPAEQPAPEAPAEPPAEKPKDTTSDARVKNIIGKYVLSDEHLKTVKAMRARKQARQEKPKGALINSNILAGCQGGF